MNGKTKNSIYIISGPYGVGKSTVSKELANKMERVALIEGDQIKLMLKGKNLPLWEEYLTIIWQNIISLTQNYIENNINVIIDYAFESEMEWFYTKISELNVKIHYIVLRADEEILIKRLKKRGDLYLIEGSLSLLNKLEQALPSKNYLFDTTHIQPDEIINVLQSNFELFEYNPPDK